MALILHCILIKDIRGVWQMIFRRLIGFGSIFTLFAVFQNCSKVAYTSNTTASLASASGAPPEPPHSGPVPTGPNTPTTMLLQTIKPVFAVRGANCLVCHG